MLTLKKLKIAKNLSRETLAYTAHAFWHGRPIGAIENDGGGGMSLLRPVAGQHREDVRAAEAFARAQKQDLGPGYGLVAFATLEDYIDHIAGEQGDRQDAKRWLTRTMKTKVAFIEDGKVYSTGGTAPIDVVKAAIFKRHPNATVLNGLPIEDAVDRYLATAA